MGLADLAVRGSRCRKEYVQRIKVLQRGILTIGRAEVAQLELGKAATRT